MDEKPLLTWTVKHRGPLTSKRNLLILLTIFLFYLIFFVFNSHSPSQQKDSSYDSAGIASVIALFLFIILIILMGFSKKEFEFTLTNKAIYKKMAGSKFLGFYQDYTRGWSEFTGERVSNQLYVPYNAIKYFKVGGKRISIIKKTNLLNSGLLDFSIISNNNRPSIINILSKYIKRKE